MSYLVLHMEKFKKDAIRGIESHNRRKRRSRTNPDIDYGRSAANYDLAAGAPEDYAAAVQDRIDRLLLTRAVRKDAVQLCGLVVSSDREFFQTLTPEETRRFFEESAKFLTGFVGRENVISAMVHMDETTPHMHFFHVPVTKDGRLSAKDIYTRRSLKRLQAELPRHLQTCGFAIERGVEQTPGSAKKHLDTREFKQQREALSRLQDMALLQEMENKRLQAKCSHLQKEQEEYEKRLEELKRQAQAAAAMLEDSPPLPKANMFNFSSVLAEAKEKIDRQREALCLQEHTQAENARLKEKLAAMTDNLEMLQRCHAIEVRDLKTGMASLQDDYDRARNHLRFREDFFSRPDIAPRLEEYLRRREAEAEEKERLKREQEAETERQKEAARRQREQELETRRQREFALRREEAQSRKRESGSLAEARPEPAESAQRIRMR